MLNKFHEKQQGMELIILEQLVPQEHLLRKIDRSIDFSFIRRLCAPLYSANLGRPAIEPEVLFRMLFVGYLYGIRSERRLEEEINYNMAYKWFCGLSLTEKAPDATTLSVNRKRRFRDNDIPEQIFNEILRQAMEKGLVGGTILYTDSTHVKAKANKHKKMTVVVERTPKAYLEELDDAIERDRKELGKKPFDKKDDDDPPPTREVQQSKSDPESGQLHKEGKPDGFHYSEHRTVDSKHNIVVNVRITPANVNDVEPIAEILKDIDKRLGKQPKYMGLDAGYHNAPVCHQLAAAGIQPVVGYRRHTHKGDYFGKYRFTYDPIRNVYRCPEGRELTWRTTNREGYREYWSEPKTCRDCPKRAKCFSAKSSRRQVTRHVWQDALEQADAFGKTSSGKRIYARRKETIERSFAEAKELHGLRYARMLGIRNMYEQSFLTAAVQNMKRIARAFRSLFSVLPYACRGCFPKKAALVSAVCAAPKMRGGIALFTIIRRQHVKASLEAAREVAYAGKTHRSRYLRNGTLLFQQQAARHVQAVRIEIFAEAHAKVALKAAAEITLRIAQLGGNIAGGQIAGIAPGNAGRYPAAKILVQRGRGGAQSFQTGRQQRKHQHQMPACHQRPPGGMFLTGPDNRKQMIGYLRSDGILLFQHATKRRHVHIRLGKGRISVMQQRKIKANAVFTQWRGAVRSGFMGHKGRDENHLSCVDGQGFPVKGNDSVAGFQIQHLKFPVQMALVPSSGCHVIARAAGNIAGNGQLRKFGHKVLKIHAGPSLRVSVYHAQARPSRVRKPAIPFLYSLIACSLRSLTFMVY